MKKVVIVISLIIVFTILLLYFYDKKISIRLIEYAKIESKRIGIELVSKGVSNEVVKVLDDKDIFSIEKDNNGNIELINYNTKVVNEILSVSAKTVNHNFKKLEKDKKGIISYIPMGITTNNIFLENLGPRVPVKLYLNGNVVTSLKTNVKPYGLNSALVEINIKIEAVLKVLVPLKTEQIKIVNDVPVSIKIVEGNVSSLISSYNQ
ncbi:MAG: sporulation protein YunB [Bacilli bacterium]|nr:sporulation protein YunB [Bacilli bacterium]